MSKSKKIGSKQDLTMDAFTMREYSYMRISSFARQ